MTKRTVLTDPDGVDLEVASVPKGYPFAEDAVAIHSHGPSTAWVSARELIEAIEKAAGIEKTEVRTETFVDPDIVRYYFGPEPLWTEVRERPARAVKVTPELVRTLADAGREQGELAPLEPVFNQSTGEPEGVTWFDYFRALDVTAEANGNTYVILRQGQVPQMLGEKEFEQMYEEVA